MKFVLVCPRHTCKGNTFEAAVVVDKNGQVVALDSNNDGDGFYCQVCGSKAIAYKSGKGRTIGDQLDIPQGFIPDGMKT